MTDKSYERVFNIVSAAGVAMLMIPLFLILLGNVFPYSVAVLPFAAAASTMFGYGVQWLFGAVTGKRASHDGFDDFRNGVLGRFRIAYAAIPLAVNLAVSLGIFFLFDHWLSGLAESGASFSDGRLVYYTVLYSIFAAGLFFFASTAGCVIWFYPIERLSNIYTLIGGCVLFFIESFFLRLLDPLPRSAVCDLFRVRSCDLQPEQSAEAVPRIGRLRHHRGRAAV